MPWSLGLGSNIAQCYRFETRFGDLAPGETDRTRSELQFDVKYDFDRDVWFGWFIRATAIPGVVTDSWVIGQAHQSEDPGDASGFPPFEFNLHADGLYIFTASVAEASRPTFYPRTQRAGPIPFALGVFHNVVVRIRFNWIGNALLYVWIDGELVVAIENVSIGMNDAEGCYLKIGTYTRPVTATQTSIVEYVDVVEGYGALPHRILMPAPLIPFA